MAKWTINNRENKHSKMIGNMNIGNYIYIIFKNVNIWKYEHLGNMNIWEIWTFGKHEHLGNMNILIFENMNFWGYKLLGTKIWDVASWWWTFLKWLYLKGNFQKC